MEYTEDFIQAINDWQAFGLRDRKIELYNNLMSFDIPLELKQCDQLCYRITDFRVKIPALSMLSAGISEQINIGVSSWTLDKQIAKDFYKKYSPLTPSEGQNYIIKIYPKPQQIVLNLDRLYKDELFRRQCKKYKSNIKNYEKGIGCWENSQREVILNVNSISVDNICAFWGYSSTPKEFYKKYGDIIHSIIQTVKEEERENFAGKVYEFLNQNLGDFWLEDEESVRNKIKFLKDEAKKLDEYRKLFPMFFY